MARVGRKPLGAAHVDHLTGSPLAKERLRWILQTMRGERTVEEACRALSIGPSRFHAMRNRWLQRAVGLLEPRRAGRPPQPPPPGVRTNSRSPGATSTVHFPGSRSLEPLFRINQSSPHAPGPPPASAQG